LGDVTHSTPETRPFEIMEIEVAIERCGSVVDRVDDNGSSSELSAAPGTAAESVDQKMTPQPIALFRTVEGQPGEHDDGDSVGHTTTQTGRRGHIRYGTHNECVVPDHRRPPA
jgi:hypothetical protein